MEITASTTTPCATTSTVTTTNLNNLTTKQYEHRSGGIINALRHHYLHKERGEGSVAKLGNHNKIRNLDSDLESGTTRPLINPKERLNKHSSSKTSPPPSVRLTIMEKATGAADRSLLHSTPKPDFLHHSTEPNTFTGTQVVPVIPQPFDEGDGVSMRGEEFAVNKFLENSRKLYHTPSLSVVFIEKDGDNRIKDISQHSKKSHPHHPNDEKRRKRSSFRSGSPPGPMHHERAHKTSVSTADLKNTNAPQTTTVVRGLDSKILPPTNNNHHHGKVKGFHRLLRKRLTNHDRSILAIDSSENRKLNASKNCVVHGLSEDSGGATNNTAFTTTTTNTDNESHEDNEPHKKLYETRGQGRSTRVVSFDKEDKRGHKNSSSFIALTSQPQPDMPNIATTKLTHSRSLISAGTDNNDQLDEKRSRIFSLDKKNRVFIETNLDIPTPMLISSFRHHRFDPKTLAEHSSEKSIPAPATIKIFPKSNSITEKPLLYPADHHNHPRLNSWEGTNANKSVKNREEVENVAAAATNASQLLTPHDPTSSSKDYYNLIRHLPVVNTPVTVDVHVPMLSSCSGGRNQSCSINNTYGATDLSSINYTMARQRYFNPAEYLVAKETAPYHQNYDDGHHLSIQASAVTLSPSIDSLHPPSTTVPSQQSSLSSTITSTSSSTSYDTTTTGNSSFTSAASKSYPETLLAQGSNDGGNLVITTASLQGATKYGDTISTTKINEIIRMESMKHYEKGLGTGLLLGLHMDERDRDKMNREFDHDPLLLATTGDVATSGDKLQGLEERMYNSYLQQRNLHNIRDPYNPMYSNVKGKGNRRSRFKSFAQSFIKYSFSHVGICVLVVAYILMGAFTFRALEYPNERMIYADVRRLRDQTSYSIWRITRRVNPSNRQRYMGTVDRELQLFQTKVVKWVQRSFNGTHIRSDDYRPQWSLNEAFLYSLTVITTIGYGNLTPKTLWGKIVTMVYAVFGIPLLLLYITNIGGFLAHMFKYMYFKSVIACCRTKKKRVIKTRASIIEIRPNPKFEREALGSPSSPNYNSPFPAIPSSPELIEPVVIEKTSKKGSKSMKSSKKTDRCHTKGMGRSKSANKDEDKETTNGSSDCHDRRIVKDKSHSEDSKQRQGGKKEAKKSKKGYEIKSDKDSTGKVKEVTVKKSTSLKKKDKDKWKTKRASSQPEFRDTLKGMSDLNHDEATNLLSTAMSDSEPKLKVFPYLSSSPPPFNKKSAKLKGTKGKSKTKKRSKDEEEDKDTRVNKNPVTKKQERNYGPSPTTKSDDLHVISLNIPRTLTQVKGNETNLHTNVADLRGSIHVNQTPRYGAGDHQYPNSYGDPELREYEKYLRGAPKPGVISSQFNPLETYQRRSTAFSPYYYQLVPNQSTFDNINNNRQRPSSMLLSDNIEGIGVKRSKSLPGSDYWAKQRKSHARSPRYSYTKITVPVWLSITVVILYVMAGTILFSTWEEWDYIDGSYFCFITLSTIGFGDLVPGEKVLGTHDSDSKKKLAITSIYILVGMAIIAMCFNLMQEQVTRTIKNIGIRLGIVKDDTND